MTKEERRQEIGKRVKYFRKNWYEDRKIPQTELLIVFGGVPYEGRAPLISMIESGDRSLTEENIHKMEEKYGVQGDYFRFNSDYSGFKCDHMKEEDELKASSDKHFAAQKVRNEHFKNIMVKHGLIIQYKDCFVRDKSGNAVRTGYDCIIKDKAGNVVTFDPEELNNLIDDFEEHLAFHIQRRIMQEADRISRENIDKSLLEGIK